MSLLSIIIQELGRIDVCINNAGLNFKEQLLQFDLQHLRQMIDINVLGLIT